MLHVPPSVRPLLPYGLLAASLLLLLHHHYALPSKLAQLDQIAVLDQRPINGRFPSWYGNPDEVGLSPWDWTTNWEPKEVVGARGSLGGRKRRLLFLTGTSLCFGSSGRVTRRAPMTQCLHFV
jgi:hypothetical protein